MTRAPLRLAWIDTRAARYAVEHWHYSGTIPVASQAKLGVWEHDQFIGAIIFGKGSGQATNGLSYGLAERDQIAELTRIALRTHTTPVSRMISIAVRMIRRQSPGLRLLISFADPAYGHNGAIYQASNWTYTGTTAAKYDYRDRRGRRYNDRQVAPNGQIRQFGKTTPAPREDECERIWVPGKHRYLYPLDAETAETVAALAKPHPKPVDQAALNTERTRIETDLRQKATGKPPRQPAGRGRFDSDPVAPSPTQP